MRCISCDIDVPPQWVACIQANSCPNCGGPIMNDTSKELLVELKLAMEKMPTADAASISGWLLSNYTLTKIGSAEPTEFYPKKSKQSQVKNRKLKVANNVVQDFLKRKDPGIAKSVEAQKDLASIAEQINSGEIVEDLYGDGEELDPEAEIDNEDYQDEYVDEDLDPYQEAELNRRQFKSQAKKLAKHSLLMPGGRQLSAAETAAMMEAVAGKNAGMDPGSNMPEALQVARLERLRKQRAIAEGGVDDFGQGKGTFRRGS